MYGIILLIASICAAFWGWANQAPRAQTTVCYAEPHNPLEVVLSAEDPEGDALHYELLDAPSHGKLLGSPPYLTYCPDPDFEGSDRFSFRVTDSFGSFDIGFVEIRVSHAFMDLRIVPNVPKEFTWADVLEFLVGQGVRTWYVVDIEPRVFTPSVLPFVFAGAGREAQAFVVGPLASPAIKEVACGSGSGLVDLRGAPPGTYLLLWVSGTEAFSYPFRIELPVLDRKLTYDR